MGYPPQGWIGTAVSIHSGAAFPPTPHEGDCFYRTDLNEFFVYDGAAWVRWEIETHAVEHQTGGTDDLESLLRLANFAERAHASLTGVTADLHHTENHEARHVLGGADAIDEGLNALAIALTTQGDIVYRAAAANTLARLAAGAAGQALLTGGPAANPSWGAPAPAAHVLATTGPHTNTLPLTDLAVGARGSIIRRGAADWEEYVLGAATRVLKAGATDVAWGQVDYAELTGVPGSFTPSAHVLATTGPHTDTLPLTDLEVGVQGNIIHRGAADWMALAVGAAGQALLSGGAGANVSWGAPAPAAHVIDGVLHTAAGLTIGHVIRATGAAAFAFAQLQHADLGGVTSDLHHAQAHHAAHESGGADETRDMELDTSLANLTASGLKSLVTVGEIVSAGDGLFLYSDGKYHKSDASAAATMPVKVMALADAAADATVLVLHEGYYRNDALYNWTPGAGVANLLYADVNAGLFVQFAAKPAGAGDQVQVVGWIVNANQIYFHPCLELVEIAA